MSRTDLKLLKSKDPAERMTAIKSLARDVDKRALKQLALMSGDDPDLAVRDLALKAGRYILSGGAAAQKKSDKGAAEGSPSNKREELMARRMLESAMTHNINNDRVRLMRTLSEAMKLYPPIVSDGYFLSLAESATGESGQAAFDALADSGRVQQVEKQQIQEAKEKDHAAHEEVINAASWADVAFDLGLVFIIATVGAFIGLFLLVESAQSYVGRVENNVLAIEGATAAGRTALTEDGETVYLNELGEPITQMEPDENFLQMSENIGSAEIADIIFPGLGIGFGTMLLVFLMFLVIYALGNFVLRGHGNLPYLGHRVSTLMAGRMIGILLFIFVATTIVFNEGGGSVINIIMAMMGLIVLLLIFSMIGVVSKAFNFGFVKGFVSTAGGVAAAAIIAGGVFITLIG